MLKDVYNVELVDRSFGSCGYNAAKKPRLDSSKTLLDNMGHLETTRYTAFARQSVTAGTRTNVSVIKKSAFSGCSNLTGVVLPKTLKELGSRSSSAGSVFNGCEGLRYIRVAGSSNQNAVFELPEGLT